MIKKQILLAILSLCFLAPINAKTNITPVGKKRIKNGQSIFYALPKNELAIKITTIHTWNKRGPFYRYAGRFLAEENIITEDNDIWSINSIEIKNIATADTAQIFQIKPSKKSIANLITLNNNGVICSINAPKHKKTTTDITSDIKEFKETALNFDKSVLGEEALIANSTAKMAELAAKQIYRIRENRISLLTGDLDFPADSESLRILLTEMDKTEQKLLELFVGKQVKDTCTETLYFTPDADTDEVFVRFSKDLGLVSKDDLSGEPIYIKVVAEKRNLNLHPKKREKSGIHYRYPAMADITIYNAKGNLLHQRYAIAQLGDILILPQKLLQKNNHILFDENNGRLLQIREKK